MLAWVSGEGHIAPPNAPVPAPAGLWRADDGSSVIEIESCGEALCGTLVSFLPVPGDAKANAQLCNLQILGDFKQGPNGRWTGGWIFDPEGNKTYRGWLEPASPDWLRVRAYEKFEILGEAVVWRRPAGTVDRCVPSERY